MSQFLDYNKERGVWYDTDYNAHEDKLYIHTKQDVQPVLDWNATLRNSGKNDKVGEWNHYATIPTHVEIEMKQKYGVSIYNPHQTKEMLKILNRDYPHLKTTNLTHE